MNAPLFYAVVGSYLLGAIPFGLFVGRAMGVADVRAQGSGNIGATNLLRVAGRKAGALTLLLDMLKGALPVILARFWLEGVWSDDVSFLGLEKVGLTAIGLATFLGHLYPVYLGFKGGKGVATGLGVMLAFSPLAGLSGVVAWLVTAWLFRISSLAALVAFTVMPLAGGAVAGANGLTLGGVMALFVFWRHRSNIGRLAQGSEPRIGKRG